MRPHPLAEALHGRVHGLIDWQVVDVPEVATPTSMTVAVSSVVMATVTSVGYECVCVCTYACMSEWGGGWVHAHACGRYMHACVCVCVCVCVEGVGVHMDKTWTPV